MMKKYLIPILIFLAFICLYAGISAYQNNYFLFLPVWDIAHYVSISETGYQVYPCTPGVEYPAGKICGNAGWHPFWPLVIKLFRPILGNSSRTAFIVLSIFFTLLSLLILYRFVEKKFGRRDAIITALALSFGPASFYFLTGFPYAILIFLFAVYIWLFYESEGMKRDIGLFLTALAISLTYPSGILFACIPLVKSISSALKSRQEVRFKIPWKRAAIQVLPFILGPLLLWGYFYFRFDDFFLQLHFQEKYQRTWAIPFEIIFNSFAHQPLLSPENVSIIWYGLVFLLFIPAKIEPELWIAALVLYLFSPATGTTMSIYRHYLIIFPAYLMIGTSHRPVWLKLGFIAAGLILAMMILFPLFISSKLI